MATKRAGSRERKLGKRAGAAGALLALTLWQGAVAGQPLFTDVAPAAQLIFTGTYGSTFPELVDEPFILVQRDTGNGAAVGDYDRDGDLDVYLLGQLDFPNKLFRNNLGSEGPAFTDVTAGPLGDLGHSRVAHFVDLDVDGWLDLLVINDDNDDPGTPPSKILRNNRDSTFTDVTVGSGFQPVGYLRAGCALADYDRDGLVDIYVTVWTAHTELGPPVFPGSNRLYRNLGDFTFEDVTGTVGLGTLDRDSFSAVFTDFDDDTFPDLYVAVDHTSDEFFFNNAGASFTNATAMVGATHTGNDMGVAPADFDDDGDLDLYFTNITDPSGSYGTTQGNVLAVNQEDTAGVVQFIDQAVAHGVDDTFWGWGTEFVDVENDGDLDLVAVSGMDEFILESIGDLHPLYQTPSVLFVNDGAGNFSRLTGAGLDDPDDSRALIAFDYDRDGDQDLLITNVDQPVRLLENNSANQGHWLDVALEPDDLAIGARVYATLGAVTKRRDVIAGRSYLAGTPSEVHFGLGAATTVDTLRVVWADGSETVLEGVAADQLLRLESAFFADGFESGDLSGWGG
ncbi:MAG: CRTAC1 family protein [bacterium]|nr:CRTAC1 family protein [bacterium]